MIDVSLSASLRILAAQERNEDEVKERIAKAVVEHKEEIAKFETECKERDARIEAKYKERMAIIDAEERASTNKERFSNDMTPGQKSFAMSMVTSISISKGQKAR